MVSIRRRRLQRLNQLTHASTSEGTNAGIREVEPTRIRSPHGERRDQQMGAALVMPMSLTPSRSSTASMDLPSTESQLEVTAHTIDSGDDSVGSEGEHRDAPENVITLSSGESSEGSLETRYLRSWRESPSVTSRPRTERVAVKREKSIELHEYPSTHTETDTASPGSKQEEPHPEPRIRVRQTERRSEM